MTRIKINSEHTSRLISQWRLLQSVTNSAAEMTTLRRLYYYYYYLLYKTCTSVRQNVKIKIKKMTNQYMMTQY